AVLLGTLFARMRDDRVIAIDADPDYGTLGRNLAHARPMFVDDLAQLVDQPALTPGMLDRMLARGPDGLKVLPAPADPERMDSLDQRTYERVIQRVKAMAKIVVLDCGAGMRGQATRAALRAADQLVLVTEPEPATIALVADAARDLAGSRPFALVVNKSGRHGIDRQRVAQQLPGAQSVLELPSDRGMARRLAIGSFTWDVAPPSWDQAARELAAGLVGGWELLRIPTL